MIITRLSVLCCLLVFMSACRDDPHYSTHGIPDRMTEEIRAYRNGRNTLIVHYTVITRNGGFLPGTSTMSGSMIDTRFKAGAFIDADDVVHQVRKDNIEDIIAENELELISQSEFPIVWTFDNLHMAQPSSDHY